MGNCETDWSHDVLEHIVALLFALADLADRAAGAPFLRRRQVLGILAHGEAEARAFLIGTATGAQAQADMPASAEDAIRLAARLRALALLLCALLAQPFAPPDAARPRAGYPARTVSRPAVRRPDTPAVPVPDTS